ncbi:MAG: hypothetical protein Q8M20_18070 [Rhodocyclaceae bacterium]|nr:hypothetical protein [Rhodocyclaceae bacterium]
MILLLILVAILAAAWLRQWRATQYLQRELEDGARATLHAAYLLSRAESRNTRLHNRLAAVRAAVETSLHTDLHP